jgi:hypothetical protein
MPATNVLEYARGIEGVLDAAVAAGEAALVSIQIDPRSALRGFIAGVLQFGDASELHFREFVDTSLDEPRFMYAYHYQEVDKGRIPAQIIPSACQPGRGENTQTTGGLPQTHRWLDRTCVRRRSCAGQGIFSCKWRQVPSAPGHYFARISDGRNQGVSDITGARRAV